MLAFCRKGMRSAAQRQSRYSSKAIAPVNFVGESMAGEVGRRSTFASNASKPAAILSYGTCSETSGFSYRSHCFSFDYLGKTASQLATGL